MSTHRTVPCALDDGLASHIMTLTVEVGDTPLREMSMHQLECVYDVLQIVMTTIQNANKAFKEARGATITEMGNSAMREVRKVGGSRQYAIKALESAKKFGWDLLKPYYAFSLIGSDTLSRLYENVRKGEDVWATDVTEARCYTSPN